MGRAKAGTNCTKAVKKKSTLANTAEQNFQRYLFYPHGLVHGIRTGQIKAGILRHVKTVML